jgi:hypothetical protein
MNNNNLIDVSFFAAKLATLNNEKAKLVVDSVCYVGSVKWTIQDVIV